MTISEKNGYLLAAVIAGLTSSNVSAVTDAERYVSPQARFTSVENFAYSIDSEVQNELAGIGGSH